MHTRNSPQQKTKINQKGKMENRCLRIWVTQTPAMEAFKAFPSRKYIRAKGCPLGKNWRKKKFELEVH